MDKNLLIEYLGRDVITFALPAVTVLFEHLDFRTYLGLVRLVLLISGLFDCCNGILCVEARDIMQLGHRSLADVGQRTNGYGGQGPASMFGLARVSDYLDQVFVFLGGLTLVLNGLNLQTAI